MNTTASNPQSNIEAEPADAASSADATPSAGRPGATAYDMVGGLKNLRRPIEGRMLGGVAAGIATYLGADVNLVRLGIVVLAFVGGAALPLYVVAWLLIPEEGSDQSIAGDLFSSLENRSR
jgi:phage shock protein PspC (stress-responsive transcriptional regulator)